MIWWEHPRWFPDLWHSALSEHMLLQRKLADAADKELLLEGVRQQALGLHLLSAEECSDRDIVFAALQQNGSSLRHAAPALQADIDVVSAALRRDGFAIFFANPGVQDREILLPALQHHVARVRLWRCQAHALDCWQICELVQQCLVLARISLDKLQADEGLALEILRLELLSSIHYLFASSRFSLAACAVNFGF